MNRTIPTSYSGQMDVILNPRRCWPAPREREEVRPDIVRAIRLNASIDLMDAAMGAAGVRGKHTSIRSEPVYLPSHF